MTEHSDYNLLELGEKAAKVSEALQDNLASFILFWTIKQGESQLIEFESFFELPNFSRAVEKLIEADLIATTEIKSKIPVLVAAGSSGWFNKPDSSICVKPTDKGLSLFKALHLFPDSIASQTKPAVNRTQGKPKKFRNVEESKTWDDLELSQEMGLSVKVCVREYTNQGIRVDYKGIKGYIAYSSIIKKPLIKGSYYEVFVTNIDYDRKIVYFTIFSS